ncbi:MAG TPA: hypothetical protein VLJ21_03055 [Candidatus Binatia bacterium]|nr:hypothetical protein [Candidatus Binatia bacterium]
MAVTLEKSLDFAFRALDCPLGERLWRPTLLFGVECDVLAEKSMSELEIHEPDLREIVKDFDENRSLFDNRGAKTVYRRIFQNDRDVRICYDAQVAQHIRIPRKEEKLLSALRQARRKGAGRERVAISTWNNLNWEIEYELNTLARNRYTSSLSEGKVDPKMLFNEIISVVKLVQNGDRLLPKDLYNSDDYEAV